MKIPTKQMSWKNAKKKLPLLLQRVNYVKFKKTLHGVSDKIFLLTEG